MPVAIYYFKCSVSKTSGSTKRLQLSVLGVDNAKSGICYMYICMWDGTYAL